MGEEWMSGLWKVEVGMGFRVTVESVQAFS